MSYEPKPGYYEYHVGLHGDLVTREMADIAMLRRSPEFEYKGVTKTGLGVFYTYWVKK